MVPALWSMAIRLAASCQSGPYQMAQLGIPVSADFGTSMFCRDERVRAAERKAKCVASFTDSAGIGFGHWTLRQTSTAWTQLSSLREAVGGAEHTPGLGKKGISRYNGAWILQAPGYHAGVVRTTRQKT